MSVESGAHVGAQFKQLPMFMSAREIKSQYMAWGGDREPTGDEGEIETDEELFDRKYKEAVADGLHHSVLSEGVKRPVALEVTHPWWNGNKKPEIMGGHHRIEVMARHKPDALMPVEHVSDFKEARRSQATHDQADIDEAVRRRGYR